MDVSLLSWWDTAYMLQILLIYDAMKLINILYLSCLFCDQCFAVKACPTSNTPLPKCLLNKDSVLKFCVEFVACCLHADCSSWWKMVCSWTLYLLYVCLKDHQLLQYIDMNLCDNEERYYEKKEYILQEKICSILTFCWLVVEVIESAISWCERLLCPTDQWICRNVLEIESKTEYNNQKHWTAKHVLPFKWWQVAPYLLNRYNLF
jgi:hypothetical protein